MSVELVRYDGTNEVVIAHIDSRANPHPQSDDLIRPRMSGPTFNDVCPNAGLGWPTIKISFDRVNGRLLIPLHSYPRGGGPTTGWWIAAINGFATLYEVQQSYVAVSQFSFRVPQHPNGFQFADFFDTHYGSIGNYDLAQAQPLQCGYPATPPNVGDYLTVSDTLPTPGAGQGFWYLTAVNYQGETRIGRKASGGVLSGRDSSVLPGCGL